MVAHGVSIEHEYAALLFSIDGLRHRILRSLPVQRESDGEDYYLSKDQFLGERLSILEGTNFSANRVQLWLT